MHPMELIYFTNIFLFIVLCNCTCKTGLVEYEVESDKFDKNRNFHVLEQIE